MSTNELPSPEVDLVGVMTCRGRLWKLCCELGLSREQSEAVQRAFFAEYTHTELRTRWGESDAATDDGSRANPAYTQDCERDWNISLDPFAISRQEAAPKAYYDWGKVELAFRNWLPLARYLELDPTAWPWHLDVVHAANFEAPLVRRAAVQHSRVIEAIRRAKPPLIEAHKREVFARRYGLRDVGKRAAGNTRLVLFIATFVGYLLVFRWALDRILDIWPFYMFPEGPSSPVVVLMNADKALQFYDSTDVVARAVTISFLTGAALAFLVATIPQLVKRRCEDFALANLRGPDLYDLAHDNSLPHYARQEMWDVLQHPWISTEEAVRRARWFLAGEKAVTRKILEEFEKEGYKDDYEDDEEQVEAAEEGGPDSHP